MEAKDILMRAINCDKSGRIWEALHNYEEGIEILMNLVKNETDIAKKKIFYERIKEYMDRAEQIKERIQRHLSRGELVAHIAIDENKSEFSYDNVFGKYINSDVKEVHLEEPYLVERYQFQNLIAFFALLIKKSENLKFIKLITKPDVKTPQKQENIFEQIKSDLSSNNVTLTIQFDISLHDRKIALSNGYIIKIGRGLHYFKATNPYFSLGMIDYDFRKCSQTDVDIWRTKYVS